MADQSDFMSEAMAQGLHGLRAGFNPGEKLHARITLITHSGVFVDVNAKSEGIVDRAELEVDGQLKHQVGDHIDVYYKETNKGEMRFTARVRARSADADAVENAFRAGIPVEGKVTAERTGGFEITIGGIKAFCPFSQIGLRGQRNEESPSLVGQHFQFLVSEFEDERNVVVSRRRLLELEQEQVRADLKARLKEGDTLSGKVSRLADFGAFVDLGAGLDGLIPMSELGHGRVKKAGDVVQPGDEVSVRVLKLDWERGRISLSLRSLQADPWLSVAERFAVGGQYPGTVTRLTDFGAFVKLADGVEGLLHISLLATGQRLGHASEALKEGQELSVFIAEIDLERKRLSLSLKAPEAPAVSAAAPSGPNLVVGSQVAGVVEEIKPFGVFIRLSNGQTGLLHVSELGPSASTNRAKELGAKYPKGSEVQVEIKQVQADRISLALPGSLEERRDFEAYRKQGQTSASSFGSLGGMFDKLKL